MPEGGRFRVTLEQAAAKARLSFTDHGAGMSEEVSTRLFEPFFTTKPEGQGTGLGLATVYGIVTAAKGTIAIESTLGEGSSIVIELPLTADTVAEPSAEPRPVPLQRRVVVVDDDPLVLAVVKRVLESFGYEAASCADSASATAALSKGGAQLLVTDVGLAEESGWDRVATIRRTKPGLPVLFVSGRPDEPQTRAALGPTAFLAKPFTANELGDAVDALLDGSAQG